MASKKQNRVTRHTDVNTTCTLDPLPRLISGIFELADSPGTAYLRKTVMSKYCDPNPESTSNRARRAVAKWLAIETRNRETNLRIKHTCWAFHILPGVPLSRFLRFTDSLIGAVLREPSPEVLFGGFSGGASTSRARASSHPAEKYRGRADVTPKAYHLFDEVILSEGWFINSPCEIREVPGNVMFTVPKNSDIDRCACKEPDGNMYMQKGVGNYIRARLRKFGIDLNDQSRNKALACEGSLTGLLATVDLSAASDSVTTSLCELLLPKGWFNLLMQLRSDVTTIPGSYLEDGSPLVHTNEMMSSMGNGFTFELESLLFWVIAKAVAYFGGYKGIISVYGDDIIIPVDAYHDLAFVLSYLGFSINADKSFWTGPFRESCGGHYYNGRDITPFYVKAPVRSLIDLIHLGNQIRSWAMRVGYGMDLYEVWTEITHAVPRRFRGGRDLSDKTALVTDESPSHKLSETSVVIRRHIGDYIYWLDGGHANGPRKRATGRYRARPNRAGPFFPAPQPWLQDLLTT